MKHGGRNCWCCSSKLEAGKIFLVRLSQAILGCGVSLALNLVALGGLRNVGCGMLAGNGGWVAPLFKNLEIETVSRVVFSC